MPQCSDPISHALSESESYEVIMIMIAGLGAWSDSESERRVRDHSGPATGYSAAAHASMPVVWPGDAVRVTVTVTP
jgi:hypothetical protein